ncbi:MAG: hypothetical protein DME94_06360 [Verrucomicrobia bacterium]|nr:MAG: hypothetical protein DME94_06360 [Verrucomicrobiota bacterium]
MRCGISKACILAMGSVNSGHQPPIFLGKAMRRRIAPQKHFVRNQPKHLCIVRQLWKCALVVASLFAFVQF